MSEFIEIYRDLPCLWDLSSDTYKDTGQKKVGWEILTEKLKEFDPAANEITAKKKVISFAFHILFFFFSPHLRTQVLMPRQLFEV